MSDIDKLMSKLKSKKKEETPKEDEKEKKKKTDEKVEDEEDEELENEEMDEDEEKEEDAPIPAKSTDTGDIIEHEVAVLQNDGIFRRELILILKEFVDVHKVNTQVLLDLKKLVEGDHGKK